MSDQIVVMSAGRVEQVGPPEEVYNAPASEFVARFLGASNIFEGRVADLTGDAVALDVPIFGVVPVPSARAQGLAKGDPAKLVVRAEKLRLARRGTDPDGAVSVDGVVEAVDYQGQVARYFVRVGDTQLQVINMIDEHPFAEGDATAIRLRPRDCAALHGNK